jgi:SAM-dependent methyltransferase
LYLFGFLIFGIFTQLAFNSEKPREFSVPPGGFDVIISISSFDHSGLGRYGDPVDPEGDFQAMRTVYCSLNPQGYFIFAVPIGPDVVVWNLHRRYGRERLPFLLEGWHVEAAVGWDRAKLDLEANWRQSYEPVFVLRRADMAAEPIPDHLTIHEEF